MSVRSLVPVKLAGFSFVRGPANERMAFKSALRANLQMSVWPSNLRRNREGGVDDHGGPGGAGGANARTGARAPFRVVALG